MAQGVAGVLAVGVKPPEPARAPAEHRRPIKGWHPTPWELRCVLLAASQRLPRGTGLQALLEGVERYVKLTGKGRHGPGPGPAESVAWWADVMAMVDCVGRVADSGTRLLLAPWLGRRDGPEGFRPFGT